jgi:hypothetical protein
MNSNGNFGRRRSNGRDRRAKLYLDLPAPHMMRLWNKNFA